MTARQIQIPYDPELAALLTVYVRAGETPRQAVLKSLRLRAQADGLLHPDGRIKAGGGAAGRRP